MLIKIWNQICFYYIKNVLHIFVSAKSLQRSMLNLKYYYDGKTVSCFHKTIIVIKYQNQISSFLYTQHFIFSLEENVNSKINYNYLFLTM